MNTWIIMDKIIIFLFYILTHIKSNSENEGIFVLTSLLYISINIIPSITRDTRLKFFSIFLSCILIGSCYLYISEYSILLLPINFYEIMYMKFGNKLKNILPSIMMLFALKEAIILQYILVVLLSFLVFYVSVNYLEKLENLEKNMDNMRKERQKLSIALDEKHEYIKQSQYTIKLEERNKLSQEIHDSIGHAITGSLIQMEAAKALIDIDKNKAKELLQNSIYISKEGIEDIRKYLKEIKPPKETLGINRLKLLAEEFTSNNNIKTMVIYKGDIEIISYSQWRVIHENTLEALTNSSKYSRATKINIEIQILNKFIKVCIRDDGIGTEVIKKGLGIIGMEERCAMVNGKIIVDGSSGFSITMLLPI